MAIIFTAKKVLSFEGRPCEAFAVDTTGRVSGTGTLESLRERFPGAEVEALGGELVVPGFNDAHCHVSQIALARTRVDLSGMRSTEEALGAIARRAQLTPPGEWVFAQLLDDKVCPGIDRDALDAISMAHPIAVKHFSFQRAVLNSAALAEFGYHSSQDEPEHGRLGVAAGGRLNGWVSERAWFYPWLTGTAPGGIAAPGDIDREISSLYEFNQEIHSMGITSYCDAIVTPTEHRLYREAKKRGQLTPRVSMLLWHSYFDAETWAQFDNDEFLKFAGVKCIYDGALTLGTCLCSEAYSSSAGASGMQYMGDEELRAITTAVSSAGARLAIHANGDLAIDKVLSVLERLPEGSLRHRIEHCSIVDPRIIGRLAQNRIVAVPFSSVPSLYGDRLLEFYGDEKVHWLAAHRSLLDAGVPVAASSDYPVSPLAPLPGIQSMVTRTSGSGRSVGDTQRVPVLDAIRIYTQGSAYATGDEGQLGQLAPGYLADFTVLDTDITRCDPHRIGETGIISTWIGGRKIWGE